MNPNEYIIVSKTGTVKFIEATPVDLAKQLIEGNKLVSPAGKCWAEIVDVRNGLPKWIYAKDVK